MLDFEIAPKITKDLLLSKFSEETIFCHYLGINSISKKLVRNTTRDDRKLIFTDLKSLRKLKEIDLGESVKINST